MSTPSPRLLFIACCAVLLGACATLVGETLGGGDAGGTVDASAVNASLAAVAAAREDVTDTVDGALGVAVQVEPLAQQLRSPDTVDDVLGTAPALAAATAAVDPAAFTTSVDRLDAALDAAEEAVAVAAATSGRDTWQADFLAAQADVVGALAAWSATTRDLAAVLRDDWDAFADTAAAAAVLDEDRYRYRTAEEAAGTWEIEVATRLGPLAAATAAIESALEPREAAAAAVAEADAAAAAVFARRPADG